MFRSLTVFVSLLLLLSLAGCVISPRRDTTTNNNGTANFTLSVNPGSQTVTAGAAASFTITVAPKNAFNGTVNLTATGAPSTMQAAFSATSITGGSGSSTLTVSTATSTPTGTTSLTVTGTDANSGASQSQNVSVTVQ